MLTLDFNPEMFSHTHSPRFLGNAIASQARLEQENATHVTERKSQTQLFSSLQSIIDSMKVEQSERVKALTRDVEDARAELRQLRQRSADEQETFKSSRFRLEKEAATLRDEVGSNTFCSAFFHFRFIRELSVLPCCSYCFHFRF